MIAALLTNGFLATCVVALFLSPLAVFAGSAASRCLQTCGRHISLAATEAFALGCIALLAGITYHLVHPDGLLTNSAAVSIVHGAHALGFVERVEIKELPIFKKKNPRHVIVDARAMSDYIAGISVAAAMALTALLGILFLAATSSAHRRELTICCGCFGSASNSDIIDYWTVGRAGVLAGLGMVGCMLSLMVEKHRARQTDYN